MRYGAFHLQVIGLAASRVGGDHLLPPDGSSVACLGNESVSAQRCLLLLPSKLCSGPPFAVVSAQGFEQAMELELSPPAEACCKVLLLPDYLCWLFCMRPMGLVPCRELWRGLRRANRLKPALDLSPGPPGAWSIGIMLHQPSWDRH